MKQYSITATEKFECYFYPFSNLTFANTKTQLNINFNENTENFDIAFKFSIQPNSCSMFYLSNHIFNYFYHWPAVSFRGGSDTWGAQHFNDFCAVRFFLDFNFYFCALTCLNCFLVARRISMVAKSLLLPDKQKALYLSVTILRESFVGLPEMVGWIFCSLTMS